MERIDLNCDMGEGAGFDEELALHVSSASIACGLHAGDPATMRTTLALAKARGVAPGAHPGLPDREGFGRAHAPVTPREAYDLVVYQVGALAAFAAAAGMELQHVKPHGALYNQAAARRDLADAVARAVRDVDPGLLLYGLAGSHLLEAAADAGLRTASEAFADRGYLADGTLVPRGQADALVQDEGMVERRAVLLAREGVLESVDGRVVALRVDTLCVHGDTPGAAGLARRLRAALLAEGVEVRAPGRALAPREG